MNNDYDAAYIIQITSPRCTFILLPCLFVGIQYQKNTVSTFVPKKGITSSGPKGVFNSRSSTRGSSSSAREDITMMPIGVPKVAYRVPGGQGAEWYVDVCQILID